MTLLTDELRSWIGREETYEAPEELGRASFRAFAVAIGDDNPLYRDDAYAREHGYDGIVAPPTFVCETSQYGDAAVLSEDGQVGHRWRLPLEGWREVRGGHEYEFGRPARPTDRLRVTWRVADLVEKESSRGPMLLLTSEAEVRDVGGDLLARNCETIVYQPPS